MSAKNADDLVAKADKKLASFGFFGNKYEDAAELLEKAAVQYKLAKACECEVVGWTWGRGRRDERAPMGPPARPWSTFRHEPAGHAGLPRCLPSSSVKRALSHLVGVRRGRRDAPEPRVHGLGDTPLALALSTNTTTPHHHILLKT
jgi:hypothetical protein